MSQKLPNVTPIGKRPPPPPAPPAPEFSLRFTREGLDSLIDVVVRNTVKSIRAREAAQRRTTAQSD